MLLSGCSDTAESRQDSKGSAFPGGPPSQGEIAFYDPKPRPGRGGFRPKPVFIRISTGDAQGSAADAPANVRAGSIPSGDDGRPVTRSQANKILADAQKAGVVMSPQRFQQLWDALEKFGVFKLPRYRGGIPPEDKPTIRMTSQGRTWIFLRPDMAEEELPRGTNPQELQQAWLSSKMAIVQSSFNS